MNKLKLLFYVVFFNLIIWAPLLAFAADVTKV